MEENKPAVNTAEPAAVQIQDDIEAQIASLEADKAKAIEEAANWKLAALKNKKQGEGETEEDRIRRITQEEIANSKISSFDAQKNLLLTKALRENKELKLAQLNKTGIPASVGSHSESQPVRDTIVTPDQSAAFKARGWTDKDIERYKKNLAKYGGR